MNNLVKKKPKEVIDKEISGYDIAGERAGPKMRRKQLKKEYIIISEWIVSVKGHIYRIKPHYKSSILYWVKKICFCRLNADGTMIKR